METRGWPQGDISKHFGIAKSEVSRTLKILDLPARIREEYLQVQVPMKVLRDIAGLKDDAAQTAAWESAKRTYAGAQFEPGEGTKAPKTKARRSSEDPAEIAHSTLPKRIARSVLTTRDALVSLRTEPTGKPLADTDRAMLREMRDAIDALLINEPVG